MNEKAVLLWFIFLCLELHPIYSSLSGDPLISWILTFYWLGLGLGIGPRWGPEMLVVPWVRSIRLLHQGSEHCSDWRCEIQRERLASELESVLAEGLSWLEALEKDSEWKFKGNWDGTESKAELALKRKRQEESINFSFDTNILAGALSFGGKSGKVWSGKVKNDWNEHLERRTYSGT